MNKIYYKNRSREPTVAPSALMTATSAPLLKRFAFICGVAARPITIYTFGHSKRPLCGLL